MTHSRSNSAPATNAPTRPRGLTREERAAWDAALPRLSAAGVTHLAEHGADLELLVDAWCGLVRARHGWRTAKDGTSRSTWKRLAEARRADARCVARRLHTESGVPLDIAEAADAPALDAALDALFCAEVGQREHAAV